MGATPEDASLRAPPGFLGRSRVTLGAFRSRTTEVARSLRAQPAAQTLVEEHPGGFATPRSGLVTLGVGVRQELSHGPRLATEAAPAKPEVINQFSKNSMMRSHHLQPF